ncbi:ABC transporter permease [Sutcliffiella horikoshii]|uniref:ABC transporter permease n=1 Tax=Sutcliffiella horikoshii TaxID=79883 RepID=UPI001CFD5EB3|nr:ABC transporter permease subunit [Sutcliffiella horikoshii]
MKWFKSNSWSLALLPALLFTFCLVVYGIFMAAQESVTTLNGFSLDAYIKIFENEAFLDSLKYSLRIAFVSTILSLFLGLLLTKFLYETLKNHLARTMVWLPMLFPHFVWGYMMILLFSQTGWFSTMLHALSILDSPDQFPVLTNDRYGIGIILTYTLKEIPFVVLMLLPVYAQLNRDLPNVVKTLGGNKWHVFKTVEWPWLFPVLMEAGLIVFAFILAAFEVPFLLGTTYPKMVSVLAYEWFYQGDWSKRPESFAVMMTVTAIIFGLLVLLLSLVSRSRYRLMKGNGM